MDYSDRFSLYNECVIMVLFEGKFLQAYSMDYYDKRSVQQVCNNGCISWTFSVGLLDGLQGQIVPVQRVCNNGPI